MIRQWYSILFSFFFFTFFSFFLPIYANHYTLYLINRCKPMKNFFVNDKLISIDIKWCVRNILLCFVKSYCKFFASLSRRTIIRIPIYSAADPYNYRYFFSIFYSHAGRFNVCNAGHYFALYGTQYLNRRELSPASTWVTAFVTPYGHAPCDSGTFHDSLAFIVFSNNGWATFVCTHLTSIE